MRAKHYFLAVVALSFFFIAARSAMVADDILGTWKYTISDVPPEYESGMMVFEQKDNKTVGYVENAAKAEMKDLMVEQGKVTFSTEGEHGSIKYTMMQKGDTLTGSIGTQYGDFPIKAVKQAKK